MPGRHFRKNRYLPKKTYLAPMSGVVLAGALAGSLAVAPMGGGSGSPDETRPTSAPVQRADKGPAQRAEPEPSKPPADCKPSKAKEREYTNGRIPVDELCPLPQQGELLRADAAVAFYKLNAAYQERFGEEMRVNSSYRDRDKQAELYERMPAGMAAPPGTSNHGNGIALDLGDGVQNADTPQFKWLEKNSEKYGWIHPDWAYSNPYEPWHWEFDAGQSD